LKPETDRNLEAKERGGRKRKERDGVRGRRERTRAGAAYDAGTGGGIARLFVLYNEDGTLLGKTECAASEPLKAWEWTKVDLALRNFVLAVLCFLPHWPWRASRNRRFANRRQKGRWPCSRPSAWIV